MTKIFYYSFFILFISSCHQSAISQIKTSYYYDAEQTETILNIAEKTFIPFKKEIYQGLENGVYWVRITGATSNIIIEIPNTQIKTLTAYNTLGEKMPRVYRSLFSAFEWKTNTTTMYIRMECIRGAFIPVIIQTSDEYKKNDQNHFFISGLYYGIVSIVFFINLFYYFHFKEDIFLNYSMFVLIIAGSLVFPDGFFSLFFGENKMARALELLIQLASGISGALFASSYLQTHLYIPQLKKRALFIGVLSFIGYSVFYFYEITAALIIGNVGIGIILTTYWLLGVYLIKKQPFAKFFVIAYSLILFMAIDYFLLPPLGLPNIGFTIGAIKLGGVFEMVVLTYALVYRMHVLQQENQEMKQAVFDYTTQVNTLKEELKKLISGDKNTITAANLNQREIEILTLISKGKTNKEMAVELFISINTVKYHTKKLYDKLDINSRQEAKLKAFDFQ